MVVRVPRVGVSLQALDVEHLARQLFHTLSHLSTLVHTFSHFVLEVQVYFVVMLSSRNCHWMTSMATGTGYSRVELEESYPGRCRTSLRMRAEL